MTLRVTDECIVCGACDYVCPNDAIVPSTSLYRIVATRCTECKDNFDAPQCMAACPVDCILPLASDLLADSSRDQ
jgi:Fe-S-cluster-containing hydrogenase component 2